MEIVGKSYGKTDAMSVGGFKVTKPAQPEQRVPRERKEVAGKEDIMASLGIGESIKSQDVFIQQVQHKEKQGLADSQLTGGLID